MSSTSTSLRGLRNRRANMRHSLMLYATTTRIPASAQMGMRSASPPAASTITSRVSAWTIPAIGVRPPFFTLVAVRAMAPVAGMPPKSGETTLAKPCARSEEHTSELQSPC